MTPPIHRLLSSEESLTCTDCETEAAPHTEIGSRAELLDRLYVDHYIGVLSPPEWLRPPAPAAPSLLEFSWRSRPALSLDLARLISPQVLLRQPITELAEAYIRSEALSFVDFLPALVEFFNRVQRLDLDFFGIPVNRGAGHCRFSEYSPRLERRHDCNLRVESGTTARAHGEIRPVEGMHESLITRLSVDFRPNILNGVVNLPDLEIDGFAGIDPPLITYDRRFLGRHRESVLGLSGGDASYENPLAAGEAFASAWDSVAPTPPGEHRYWMFNFTAVVDSLYAWAAQEIGTRQMMLWAYLPTAGLTDPAGYEALGIPYNTFPRRFGDVLQLLAPLFNRSTRETIRQAAPYYNPNSEYLDLEGIRRAIPDDPTELARLNLERETYNHSHPDEEALPPLFNRGPVLDWVFTDLMSDPVRLAALLAASPGEWPRITSRFQAGATDLELPWGSLHVDSSTEIRVNYALEPMRDVATGELSAHLHSRVTLNPLALENIDLEIQGMRIRARRLRANRVVVEIPSLADLFQDRLRPETALSLRLEGVEVEGLVIGDRHSGAGGELGTAHLGSLHLSYHSGAWHLEVGGSGDDSGLLSRDLSVTTPYGQVRVEEARIPEIRIRQMTSGPPSRRRLTVTIPEVHSRGNLSFSYYPRRSLTPLNIHLEGESLLSDLQYILSAEGPVQHQARATFEGQVEVAHLEHETIGAIELSTLRPESGEESEPMRGHFQFRLTRPTEEGGIRGMETTIDLDLPFMALGADGDLLEIPRETSTIEDGHLTFTPGSFVLEGRLNISGARLRGLGDGPTELGNYVFSAETMDLHDIRAQGPARFEFNAEGWSLRHPEASEEPLGLGLRVENLGLAHQPEEGGLPGGRARRVARDVVRTEVRLDHAEVEVEDLRFLEYQQLETPLGRRGRLTRIESGAITAHHLRGGGGIWAPLPIWGMVRGLFPFLGTTSGERPPTRPDPGPILEQLPPEIRCRLDSEDFFRIGEIDFRLFPLPASVRERRERHSLSGEMPRGDWYTHLRDILVNLHEAVVPGAGRSREQFALIRIPDFEAGRQWAELPESEPLCRAAREGESDAVCGDERMLWTLGPGEFFAHVYLNDPQRGGSFLFQRWPRPADHATLEELLRACVAP